MARVPWKTEDQSGWTAKTRGETVGNGGMITVSILITRKIASRKGGR